jgi:multiple antibiotic resistance protein
MIAGPGSITTAVLGSIQADSLVELFLLAAITAVVMAVVLVVFLSVDWLCRLVGDVAVDVATRLFGLLLAAIAAQYIFDGFGGALRQWTAESP